MLYCSGTEDDHQAKDDYIIGNKVYMYDAPGTGDVALNVYFRGLGNGW